jgi:outer membrane biosynthesis protein TonB
MSPARATQSGFSFLFALLVLTGLGMAALAAGCQARQGVDPNNPDQNQTDPAHAEKVEPTQPLGDAGQPDKDYPEAPPPGEPGPDPQPLPDQPSPVPDPTPEPAPEPNPGPSGA